MRLALVFIFQLTLLSLFSQRDKAYDVAGTYTERCISQHCSECRSIYISPDGTFSWVDYSPCKATCYNGNYSIRRGKKGDTLLLDNCVKYIIDGRGGKDTIEGMKPYSDFDGKKLLIVKERLYWYKNAEGKFEDYFLVKNLIK